MADCVSKYYKIISTRKFNFFTKSSVYSSIKSPKDLDPRLDKLKYTLHPLLTYPEMSPPPLQPLKHAPNAWLTRMIEKYGKKGTVLRVPAQRLVCSYCKRTGHQAKYCDFRPNIAKNISNEINLLQRKLTYRASSQIL